MRKMGYTRFDYGLPGNLIPIRQEDYMTQNPRWGSPEKADGSDTFQIYCNGGASACYVDHTLEALYQLCRRKKEADAHPFPLLRGYAEGGFQGHGGNGMTNVLERLEGDAARLRRTAGGQLPGAAGGAFTLMAYRTVNPFDTWRWPR